MSIFSIFTNMMSPKADEFEKGIANELAQRGISGNTIRPVGGTYDVSEDLSQRMRNTGVPVDFARAQVVVADRDNDRSAAFMVGRLRDGSFATVSLQNIGRPNDYTSETDKFSARRYANMYRNTLDAGATLVKPENKVGNLKVQAPAAPAPAPTKR
jgi:hypothetical protein